MLNPSEDDFQDNGSQSALSGPSDRLESPQTLAVRLRTRAELYRLLAESLYDPDVAAIAQDCAKELEAEAAKQELKTGRDSARAA
jgi:hypothetical protein